MKFTIVLLFHLHSTQKKISSLIKSSPFSPLLGNSLFVSFILEFLLVSLKFLCFVFLKFFEISNGSFLVLKRKFIFYSIVIPIVLLVWFFTSDLFLSQSGNLCCPQFFITICSFIASQMKQHEKYHCNVVFFCLFFIFLFINPKCSRAWRKS